MQKGSENDGEHALLIEMTKIGRFAAGIVVLVLGALMIAEAVTSSVANTPFMFLEGLNRGFEFVVWFVPILLAGSIMDEGRKWLVRSPFSG